MKKLISILANIVRGQKYKNTPKNKEMKGNKEKKYHVEVDEQGYRHYKKNGETHRLHGPAIIYRSGYSKYFIEGKELSKEEHSELSKKYYATSPSVEYRRDGITTMYPEEEYCYMLAEYTSTRAPSTYNKYLMK